MSARTARAPRVARAVAATVVAAMTAMTAACGSGSDAPAADTATPVVDGAVRGCAASNAPRTGGGDTAVRAIPVNRGTHGMNARTRWVASPDGCAILVVEDPASIEADPLPNGALLVSEREVRPVVIAIDGAWDVAPDPAWRTLAIGRGWLLVGSGRDTILPARWQALARETGRSAQELEANAFNASGMGYARGVALTYVQPIAEGAAPRAIAFGGWRVRWRGDSLFVGAPPAGGSQDHVEPSQWTMHTAPDWGSVTVPEGYAPPPERWATGPDIQLGVEPDSTLGALRVLELANGRLAQSRGGQIHLLAAQEPPRLVGPGALLAATLGGRFIVAVRPTPVVREGEPKLQLVVYEVP